MDFTLNEEQRALQELARDFARTEIEPVAPHHDRTGEFALDVYRKAFEVGLMNTHVPEAYGGPGLGAFENCLIAEELAAGCSGIYASMEVNTLAQAPVVLAGSEDQKERFLAPMTRELTFAAYAVTEPDAGSDVASIGTRAVRDGNDYVLNGHKMWITGAGHASWFFVLTYTDPEKKYRGMTGFLVPADTPGIRVGKKEINMGQRASDTRAVDFEDVRVPAANRLGEEGQGWMIAMGAFDRTRPPVAAGAVGVARRALEHAIRYAKEREAFGRPLAGHQAIAFMIADMAKEVAAARLLVWQAATKIDRGERNTLEAAYAKCFAADTAMRVTTDAVQIFGGYGYNTEYPVEKLMRDAKVFQIYEGTSQIQRIIIARELLKEDA
jgi:acyl-CoA dehydrogenase